MAEAGECGEPARGLGPTGGGGRSCFLWQRGWWSRRLSDKMNFLRGVMGGQSAGPQHTEAETVSAASPGRAGAGLGG